MSSNNQQTQTKPQQQQSQPQQQSQQQQQQQPRVGSVGFGGVPNPTGATGATNAASAYPAFNFNNNNSIPNATSSTINLGQTPNYSTNPIIAAAQAIVTQNGEMPRSFFGSTHAAVNIKRPFNRVCYFCEKQGTECDDERPCKSCIKAGREKLCCNFTAPPSPSSTHVDKKRQKPEKKQLRRHANISNNNGGQAVSLQNIQSQALKGTHDPDEINMMYIVSELAKLRHDHQLLQEEVQTLKSKLRYQMLEDHKPKEFEAFVVFDLTKSPAIVVGVDANFCTMLGYEMDEVKGAPWSKFVHPDYRERALLIFSSTNLSQTVNLDQVYVQKNGAIVFTSDTHTFLFGNNRMPVSDFVTVRLRAQLPSPNSLYPEGHRGLKWNSPPALTYQPNANGDSIQPNQPNQPIPQTQPYQQPPIQPIPSIPQNQPIPQTQPYLQPVNQPSIVQLPSPTPSPTEPMAYVPSPQPTSIPASIVQLPSPTQQDIENFDWLNQDDSYLLNDPTIPITEDPPTPSLQTSNSNIQVGQPVPKPDGELDFDYFMNI